MGYYVIGVGGTGAKCVEALTHLCAAGLMPKGDLYAIFVDPDRANGSLGRAEVSLKQYTSCKQLELGDTDLFKTRITIAKPDVWSPFGEEPRPVLEDFFRYNSLKARNEAAALLFDVLYSREEKSTLLDEGFRGHPSIGAAVMAHTLELGAGEPWKTFRDKLAEDIRVGAGVKVFLIGSIFGGTGASGIPTIARLIRNELEKIGQQNAKVGAAVMLPYFSFSPVGAHGMRADAENFLLSTQAALKYYYQQDGLGIFDAAYLLGEEMLSPMGKSSIGGRSQTNEPHFLEVYAALACIDFYMRDDWDRIDDYLMIARHAPDRVAWNDLPYPSGWEKLSQKIDQMTRFAFAYLCTYHPMLEHISKYGAGYRAPWYIDFFERGRIDLARALQDELDRVKRYCENFLVWSANIQTSANKDVLVDLINYNAFSVRDGGEGASNVKLLDASRFKADQFSNLTLLRPEEDEHALTRLWERMCAAKVKDKDANGVGRFMHALYRECGEE